MAWKAWILVTSALVAACDESRATAPSATDAGTTTQLRACDPLSNAAAPITLGTIEGVGRTADGTLWVVDHDPAASATDFRVFVSSAGTLQRQLVNSSDLGPAGYQIEIGSGVDQKQLTVPLANGVATSLTLLQTIGNQAEQEDLPLVAASTIASYAVASYAIPWAVEYDETTNDGHRLVVVAPIVLLGQTGNGSLRNERLFYGVPPTLTEYAVKELPQAMLACGSYLGFTVDGNDVSTSLTGDECLAGANSGWLLQNGQTVSLHDTTGKAVGLTFQCL